MRARFIAEFDIPQGADLAGARYAICERIAELAEHGSISAGIGLVSDDKAGCISDAGNIEGADTAHGGYSSGSTDEDNGAKSRALDNTRRSDIRAGALVDIVLKADQPTGRLTRGRVLRVLTNKAEHPRGIKVMLEDGRVGRVQRILERSERNDDE